MAGLDIESRLSLLAQRFDEARGGRSGRGGRKYPAALWDAVSKLVKAGVPYATLCERCGFAPTTLTNALGRLSAQEERRQSSSPLPRAVKTLVIETKVARTSTCEILFPNGVIIRVGADAFDTRLFEMLRGC